MGQITSDGGSETDLQPDDSGLKQKICFFNVPGMLVELSPKFASECDSVRSPTSPLDFNLFSNLSSAFRFQKPLSEGHNKKWDCNKVGLGSIMDSPVKPISLSDSKTILIGSQIRCKTPKSPARAYFYEASNSLPKNYPIFPNTKPRPSNLQKGSSDVLFEIGGDPLETDLFEKIQSFSLDSKRLGSEIYRLGARKVDLRTQNSRFEKESILGGSDFDLVELLPGSENKLTVTPVQFTCGDEFARPLSAEEIEQSEDYTCVISHGPVPKTTHIFGDYVLECHPNGVHSVDNRESSKTKMLCSENCGQISELSPYSAGVFLIYCFSCNKKLEEGKDIYMYSEVFIGSSGNNFFVVLLTRRGEKAFCSLDCRSEEISVDEDQEKSISNDHKSENGDEIF